MDVREQLRRLGLDPDRDVHPGVIAALERAERQLAAAERDRKVASLLRENRSASDDELFDAQDREVSARKRLAALRQSVEKQAPAVVRRRNIEKVRRPGSW